MPEASKSMRGMMRRPIDSTRGALLLLAVFAGAALLSACSSQTQYDFASVTLTRSGGIQGKTLRIRLDADGHFEIGTSLGPALDGKAAGGDMAELHKLLAAVAWDALKAEYIATPPAPDAFIYELSYQSQAPEPARTITLDDPGMEAAPPALRALLAHLSGMLDRYSQP